MKSGGGFRVGWDEVDVHLWGGLGDAAGKDRGVALVGHHVEAWEGRGGGDVRVELSRGEGGRVGGGRGGDRVGRAGEVGGLCAGRGGVCHGAALGADRGDVCLEGEERGVGVVFGRGLGFRRGERNEGAGGFRDGHGDHLGVRVVEGEGLGESRERGGGADVVDGGEGTAGGECGEVGLGLGEVGEAEEEDDLVRDGAGETVCLVEVVDGRDDAAVVAGPRELDVIVVPRGGCVVVSRKDVCGGGCVWDEGGGLCQSGEEDLVKAGGRVFLLVGDADLPDHVPKGRVEKVLSRDVWDPDGGFPLPVEERLVRDGRMVPDTLPGVASHKGVGRL